MGDSSARFSPVGLHGVTDPPVHRRVKPRQVPSVDIYVRICTVCCCIQKSPGSLPASQVTASCLAVEASLSLSLSTDDTISRRTINNPSRSNGLPSVSKTDSPSSLSTFSSFSPSLLLHFPQTRNSFAPSNIYWSSGAINEHEHVAEHARSISLWLCGWAPKKGGPCSLVHFDVTFVMARG